MYETKFFVFVHVYVSVILLLFVGVKADQSRAFNNPLNAKNIDLFLVVDESNVFMNAMQMGLMKTALNNIVTELNPVGSAPYFGVYFYGATSAVDIVVPFAAATAPAVKTKLDLRQLATTQINPSTLSSALNTVSSNCASFCRSIVPRVTVVFSSAPTSTAIAAVRQLERDHGMTVIVIGIGVNVSLTVVNQLASHPTRLYAMPIGSSFELILSSQHISSVISDVPRLLEINTTLTIPSALNGVYHTVQYNTDPYTTTSDTIVMFLSNCRDCSVFGSLSEPNPTAANTDANSNRRSFPVASGYNSIYYFRIPKGTSRFFLSVLGNGMSSLSVFSDVFSLPTTMQYSTGGTTETVLGSSIG